MLGDANQNRVVTVADLGLVNTQLAQVVTAANFLKDVNTSGGARADDRSSEATRDTADRAGAARRPP